MIKLKETYERMFGPLIVEGNIDKEIDNYLKKFI